MKTHLRCGMAAIVLLGGVGLAAAQTSPKGSPGTNDNMLAAPSTENSSSAQPADGTATAKPKSAKHAKTTHHKHHGT